MPGKQASVSGACATMHSGAPTSGAEGAFINQEGQGQRVSRTWGPALPEERRIAYDSVDPFCRLQKRKCTLKEDAATPTNWVLEYSRHVLTLLGPRDEPHGMAGGIQDDGMLEDEPDEEPGPAPPLAVRFARSAWELIELLYIGGRPYSSVAEDLVEWLRGNHTVLPAPLQGRQNAHSRIQELRTKLRDRRAEELPEYWEAIASMLAVGWIDAGVFLLKQLASFSPDDLNLELERGLIEGVAILVEQIPRLRAEGEQDHPIVPVFLKARESWKGKINKLLTSQYVPKCRTVARTGLELIRTVLLGEKDALKRCTGHWVELFVAHLFHRRPNMKAQQDIQRLAEACITESGLSGRDDKKMTPFDKITLAVLGGETEVILDLSAKTFRPWFMAHVSEVLSASGEDVRSLLEEPREGLDYGLEEKFRLQHAEDVAADDATWQSAPFYLAQCPVRGHQTLEALLVGRSVSAARDPEVLKLLDVCRQYGMDEAAIKICRNAGAHRWEQNRRGSAIAWLQHGRDDKRLNAIAHELLKQVTEADGEGLEAVGMLLDNVSTELPLSGSLAFLQRYRRLQATLALLRSPPTEGLSAQLQAAGETIFSLLTPGMAPRQFWLTILFDAIPLLEWPEFPVFNSRQTFHLMTCLEELRTSHLCEEYLKKGGEAVDALTLQRLDLALATNLGRAFVKDANRT